MDGRTSRRGRCRFCGYEFTHHHKHDYCWWCAKERRCKACGLDFVKSPGGWWCKECMAALTRFTAVMAGFPRLRPTPEELEARIAYYRDRVEQRLPLFEDLQRWLLCDRANAAAPSTRGAGKGK